MHPPTAARAGSIEHSAVYGDIARGDHADRAAGFLCSDGADAAFQRDVLRGLHGDAAALAAAGIEFAADHLGEGGGVHRDAAARHGSGEGKVAGIDAAAIDDFRRAQRNAASRAAISSGVGIDGAGVLDAVRGIEHNFSATHRHTGSFERAGVLDHAALQPVDGAGGQNDEAAGGEHRALVLDQRLDLRGFHRDVVQAPFAIELQRNSFA